MEIEETVCAVYGKNPETIREDRSLDRNTTECIHFIWYIRHCVMGETVRSIARAYRRNPRTVKYRVAKIRDGIRMQPYYAARYRQIQERGIPCGTPQEKGMK